MDAMESRRRLMQLARSADEPRSFRTKHDLDVYWDEQALLWRGTPDSVDGNGSLVPGAVNPPQEIYRVSAERSTASWDARLDSDLDSPSSDIHVHDDRSTVEADRGVYAHTHAHGHTPSGSGSSPSSSFSHRDTLLGRPSPTGASSSTSTSGVSASG